MSEPKSVLFVCVENAGRSQMAEGFLRKYAPQCGVISAGTQPAPQLNPLVAQAMGEIGIDISAQKPKLLTDEMIQNSVLINMGCMDAKSCPALFVKDVIDWNVPDPKGKDIAQVRNIRDQIRQQVLSLIKKLEM